MTMWKKLASCLFAVVLGTSLAFAPVLAFADEEPSGSKGITDQFQSYSEEDEAYVEEDGEASAGDETAAEDEYADETTEEGEAAESGYEGVSAGQDASGAWQNEAAPSTYVFDGRGLFTSSEYQELEQKAESLAKQYGMGVYFLTTDTMGGMSNPSSDERTRYATKYYMDHSLGLGQGKSGIMFVVAADSRDYVTIAYGQGSYSFSDSGINAIEEHVTDYLGDDDWYGAAEAYYDDVSGQLAYYEQHGEPGQPLDLIDYILRFGAIVLIPLIIALMVVGGWKRAMLTAQEKNEASDYLDQSSLVLTVSTDDFINSAVVATPRADDEKSSGGGGGWGGGGGGGFSSSGGGKF